MRKKITDRITIQERAKHNFSAYIKEQFALVIHSFTYDSAGYVYGWELVSKNHNFIGSDIKSLLDTLDKLKKEFNLKSYSDYKKDKLVIWTDNLKKVYGFLQHHCTDKEFFPYYIMIDDFFEVRPMKVWNRDLKTVEEIADYGQQLADDIFIKEKYFAITANQRPRRRIQKATKKAGCTVAKDIFPRSYSNYTYIKKALFGGLCYCPYPGRIVDLPMLALDLNSAYIYCLLIQKHCMSKRKTADYTQWQFYLDNPFKASIGTYKITYSTWSNKVCCYLDSNGEHLKNGKNTVTVVLTNVDLKLLLNIVNVESITCTSLQEYDLDYLPQTIRDVIVDEYIKKEYMKKHGTDFEIKLQKSVVNGIYGDTIKRLNDEDEYNEAYKDAIIAPQWGIYCTAYCKEMIFALGNKLSGWYYSDTDSIYCLDTPENRKILDEFNHKVTESVKAFCEKFGYDFEYMKNLGQFKIEAEIIKFKANKQKQYMYIDKNNKMTVKAAGFEAEKINKEESLFYADKIEFGKQKVSKVRPDTTSCTIKGRTFTSEGSYYEREMEGEELELYLADIWNKKFV